MCRNTRPNEVTASHKSIPVACGCCRSEVHFFAINPPYGDLAPVSARRGGQHKEYRERQHHARRNREEGMSSHPTNMGPGRLRASFWATERGRVMGYAGWRARGSKSHYFRGGDARGPGPCDGDRGLALEASRTPKHSARIFTTGCQQSECLSSQLDCRLFGDEELPASGCAG